MSGADTTKSVHGERWYMGDGVTLVEIHLHELLMGLMRVMADADTDAEWKMFQDRLRGVEVLVKGDPDLMLEIAEAAERSGVPTLPKEIVVNQRLGRMTLHGTTKP